MSRASRCCRWLDAAPRPVDEVIDIGVKAARALTDLHRQHVIHFDLKPANIMFRDDGGEAVFVDFGLSRHRHLPDLMAEEIRLPVGTAPYVAPEQVLRNRSDPRSDLYSLGAILYELLTGRQPFGNPRNMRALRRRIWTEPVPPSALNPQVPPWLQEIVLRCLETDPNDRYPNARMLAFELSHPDSVTLTERAERKHRAGWFRTFRRRFQSPPAGLTRHIPPDGVTAAQHRDGRNRSVARHEALAEEVRIQVERMMTLMPQARLACVHVRKSASLAGDDDVDDHGRNVHLHLLAELRHWSRPLGRPSARITFHVLEEGDPADVITTFARENHVDHLIMGARGASARRRYLGSVSSKVVAEAPCTVTVVRMPVGSLAEIGAEPEVADA
jgi:nucleotide-binding universal stress UspA family protein